MFVVLDKILEHERGAILCHKCPRLRRLYIVVVPGSGELPSGPRMSRQESETLKRT
jgi:hypothetical protein